MKLNKLNNWLLNLVFPIISNIDDGPGGGGEGDGESKGSLLSGEPTKVDPKSTEGKWFHGIEDSTQLTPFVTESPDLSTFIKSANETKNMVGANTIKLPGKDATPEQQSDFFSKLGRPETATDYTGSEGVTFSEGLEVDTETLDSFKSVFHDNGLTSSQGRSVLDWVTNYLNDGHNKLANEREASIEAAGAELKNKWGDSTENNIALANQAVQQLSDTNVLSKLESAGLTNDPDIIQWFYSLGEKMLDDSPGMGDKGQFVTGPVQAEQQIQTLKLDVDFQNALQTKDHPGHKEAVDRWRTLFEQAYPSDKKD